MRFLLFKWGKYWNHINVISGKKCFSDFSGVPNYTFTDNVNPKFSTNLLPI